MLKQKQMEELLIQNRVRKLKIEEDRLERQIEIANKSSNFADSVRMRKEQDDANKQAAMRAEQERIERQMDSNNRRREQTLHNINYHQKQVFDSNLYSRETTNQFLKSNYDMFFEEKLQEHQKRARNAADMYNQR